MPMRCIKKIKRGKHKYSDWLVTVTWQYSYRIMGLLKMTFRTCFVLIQGWLLMDTASPVFYPFMAEPAKTDLWSG